MDSWPFYEMNLMAKGDEEGQERQSICQCMRNDQLPKTSEGQKDTRYTPTKKKDGLMNDVVENLRG